MVAAFTGLLESRAAAQGVLASGQAGTSAHIPIAIRAPEPSVSLDAAWSSETGGTPQVAYLPGSTLLRQVTGTTLVPSTITATLQIVESGVCGGGVVYSSTVQLPPGPWSQSITGTAPACSGIYSTTTTLVHETNTFSLTQQTAVIETITPTLSTGQGFDRCNPPTVAEMAAWWGQSPYEVVNIYLGGVHYACSGSGQDALWVQQVAAQGWSFIATWVGPQAPCSYYTYRMSANPATAYQEGQVEAQAAADAARSFGLFGALSIIYDVEGYSGGSASCRNAVQSFMQGWTDGLHALGLMAGGYGSGCSSYLSDWSSNAPAPDQVWIAHWTDFAYNPNATVWNALCVSDSLWPNQQRIKQYGGPHTEVWGGAAMGVDSSVFDTTVMGWPPGAAPEGMQAAVQAVGMFGPDSGWVLAGGRLYRTDGAGWADITPGGLDVLGAAFFDGAVGWAAGRGDHGRSTLIGYTHDGGETWSLRELDQAGQTGAAQAVAAYFEVLDGKRLWLVLRMPSGSSFSLGRLYASDDGGASWEELSAPLGEPAVFLDAEHGWMLGGPSGDEVYRTEDGGRSWKEARREDAPAGLQRSAPAALPESTVQWVFWDRLHGWALVQEGSCVGEKEAQACRQHWRLMATADGGATWTETGLPGEP